MNLNECMKLLSCHLPHNQLMNALDDLQGRRINKQDSADVILKTFISKNNQLGTALKSLFYLFFYHSCWVGLTFSTSETKKGGKV